ncbi:MAG: formylmethanofuran dehydrogenase subunit C [Candidatus Bathyarchaeota archaeon]|nr:MAG: formylmethanofuran dehydrogenase subunit C [Candidatus Bathyarchaeota archaeon]
MEELRLTPKKMPDVPVEAEVISPDAVSGKTLKDVRALPVYVGNTKRALGDFFKVSGRVAEDASEQLIVVDGEVPDVKYVGAGMTTGRVLVEGCVGMHAGAQMSGGELVVTGSASDWAAAEMKGGLLRIHGDAGNQLGAAYRGSAEGMTGGCIVVGGSVGVEAGAFLRRGMIVIQGDVGSFLGVHMNGGEIFVFGKVSRRIGAEAKGNGGFIACLGEVEALLPTYIHDTTYRPDFMKLYLRQLREELGIERATEFLEASFRRYRGDVAVGGNGEILVAVRE